MVFQVHLFVGFSLSHFRIFTRDSNTLFKGSGLLSRQVGQTLPDGILSCSNFDLSGISYNQKLCEIKICSNKTGLPPILSDFLKPWFVSLRIQIIANIKYERHLSEPFKKFSVLGKSRYRDFRLI